nr:unnamed protein product [Callosobruchus chinensis]
MKMPTIEALACCLVYLGYLKLA